MPKKKIDPLAERVKFCAWSISGIVNSRNIHDEKEVVLMVLELGQIVERLQELSKEIQERYIVSESHNSGENSGAK